MFGASSLNIKLPDGLLPRGAPEKTASVWTRYKWADGKLKGLSVGGGVAWQGRSPGDAGNLVMFAPSHTVDFFAQYGWGKYRLSLNVSNVFDKWYLARGVNQNILLAGPERLIKLRIRRAF